VRNVLIFASLAAFSVQSTQAAFRSATKSYTQLARSARNARFVSLRYELEWYKAKELAATAEARFANAKWQEINKKIVARQAKQNQVLEAPFAAV
jgi:hypothetical protein